MRKLLTIIFVLAAFVAIIVVSATAEEAAKDKPAHEYVGNKKCKMCHKAEFTAWEATSHAKAFDVLSDEEKAKPECVKCHITGVTAKDETIEGVGCEACHGPGSDYKSAKIMSKKKWAADPETYKKMAIEAGLVYPTEETCVKCHTKEGNPNFKPFNFEEMKGKVHPTE